MWIALLASIPLLFGGWFSSCIEHQPPQAAQSAPGAVSHAADEAWRKLSLTLIGEIQARRARLTAEIGTQLAALPHGAVDEPEDRESEMDVAGTYGKLPEVIVDRDVGAIFPLPVGRPQRFSWYQISVRASATLAALDRFSAGMAQFRRLPEKTRIARFPELTGAWEDIDGQVALLAHHVRYLDTWVPQLWAQWRSTAQSGRPVQYQLTAAMQSHDPRLMDALRELLRPTRILKRPFLPEVLQAGVLNLKIATDIANEPKGRKFMAEVEGALATHWNQSAWARNQGALFHILWTRLPRDEAFARGRGTLDDHLARFPRDRAALTTGGLTTYIRGQTLVLGPGKINPRTIAHELGHLMGFGDCYLRTLSSQGPFGLGVLEWDNPLYPDDIMCDNTVGAARAEVW